ncbi:fatty acid desaturase family protein [Talaromyces islandicus]|uniref:Fatty acid desaturase family protein n=1 Tax=Talaromyces islandicus TaxID=28573 RepID=A0A0U1M7M1_TALIS|nr:fatty acid desaturase family protein [Talaromyces islandicus]
MESATSKHTVFEELRSFRSKIPRDKLRKWERPEGWEAVRKFTQDWAIILASHRIFTYHPSVLTFVAAAFLMAWGQRGIACVGHDAIHGNLASHRKVNDLITNIFLAPPLLSTATTQRKQHSLHHHLLGTKEDPDHGEDNETSLKHCRMGKVEQMNMFSLFLIDVIDPPFWFRYAVADLKDAFVPLTLWWTIAYFLSLWLLEPAESIFTIGSIRISSFVVLFHTARCTVSYCCYVFREIIDHGGLDPKSGVLQFGRVTPWGSVFQVYFQPHDDNYHLLHHALPRIPMSNLRPAHKWLMKNCEDYAKANHYDTYFEGSHALFTEQLFAFPKPDVQEND